MGKHTITSADLARQADILRQLIVEAHGAVKDLKATITLAKREIKEWHDQVGQEHFDTIINPLHEGLTEQYTRYGEGIIRQFEVMKDGLEDIWRHSFDQTSGAITIQLSAQQEQVIIAGVVEMLIRHGYRDPGPLVPTLDRHLIKLGLAVGGEDDQAQG